MSLPLQGLKLVDLSRQLPGPFCSWLLADLGMDVVTVVAPNDPMGVGIQHLQRNKRNLAVNLKDPRGKEALLRLLDGADVVLEGFRPGVARRLGIDYETLAARSPRLVYCSISGYGQDGPYRDMVGHDINYLGYAGVLGVIGSEGGPPVIPGVQIADIGGGALMAAVGILTALIGRGTTGKGQFVDVSMMDGSVAWQAYHGLLYFLLGQTPSRGEAQLTGHFPCYSVYEAKDGKYVTVGAVEPHFWKNLCEALGFPELVSRQYEEGEAREDAFRKLRAKFREKTRDEWVEHLRGVDICFGPVNTLEEMERDPQVRHRQMVVTIDDGRGGQSRGVGVPIKLSATPGTIRRPPAGLGEHSAEILRELGYAGAEVEALRRDGVI